MEFFDIALLFAQGLETGSIPPEWIRMPSPPPKTFSAQEIIGIIAVSGPFACAILAIVFHYFGKAGRCLVDTSLKHRMLRLGYSAADIERVLQADKKNPSFEATNKAKSEIVVAETLKPAVR